MKAQDAFKDIPRTPAVGFCFACGKRVAREERVHVRAVAQLSAPNGQKGVGLASCGHTYCPECGRATFDDLKTRLEAER